MKRHSGLPVNGENPIPHKLVVVEHGSTRRLWKSEQRRFKSCRLDMSERLKVSFELTGNIKDWNTPEGHKLRDDLTLSILEDECKDDPDSSRLERLKEFWLIKTELK
jgi:hypothetical protein